MEYNHQYNHIDKTLGQRIHLLGDNKTIVQRDLYSAALDYAYNFDKVALLTLREKYTNSQNKGLYPSFLRDKRLLSELESLSNRN